MVLMNPKVSEEQADKIMIELHSRGYKVRQYRAKKKGVPIQIEILVDGKKNGQRVPSKELAVKLAEFRRNQGYLARVIKDSKGWAVYRSLGKKASKITKKLLIDYMNAGLISKEQAKKIVGRSRIRKSTFKGKVPTAIKALDIRKMFSIIKKTKSRYDKGTTPRQLAAVDAKRLIKVIKWKSGWKKFDNQWNRLIYAVEAKKVSVRSLGRGLDTEAEVTDYFSEMYRIIRNHVIGKKQKAEQPKSEIKKVEKKIEKAAEKVAEVKKEEKKEGNQKKKWTATPEVIAKRKATREANKAKKDAKKAKRAEKAISKVKVAEKKVEVATKQEVKAETKAEEKKAEVKVEAVEAKVEKVEAKVDKMAALRARLAKK